MSVVRSEVRSEKDALMDRLRSFEGARAGEPLVGRDPVNEAMIRHWCDAIGDANPVYTDPAFAEGSVYRGFVAPPTMLQAWTMPGLLPQKKLGPGAPMPELLGVLDEAGFTAIVATTCEQEYARYLRLGDRVTATTIIESVSEEKNTALGPGHFITTRITYTDQHGEVVGTQRFGLLKYRPVTESVGPKPDAMPVARRPRPAVNQDTEFFWEGVKRGELLIQRCTSCGELRHPPRPMCPCRSLDWDAKASTGRGDVYSYVVFHHPPVPPFEVPYVVALIELEEGVRMVSNVVGVGPDGVAIGMPVEVTFEALDDEMTLPLFRPRSEG